MGASLLVLAKSIYYHLEHLFCGNVIKYLAPCGNYSALENCLSLVL